MLENSPDGLKNGGCRTPLVSVIIPCYNCHQFVAQAIESAFEQRGSNVEVLVVDDGSTDGSAQIALSYPVRLFQQNHQGVSAARNLGIRASLGEYLVFLDSDDRLLPDAMIAGLAALKDRPECLMAVGAHNLITQSGEWATTRSKPIQLHDGYELLLRSNFIECTSSVMFRRSFFCGNPGFMPNLTGAEDYELYLRIARASPICCHNQVVSDYRQHPSSASRNSLMMLSHTLSVFSGQWPFARKSIRHMLAYLHGSISWRQKYGRQLAVEMATSTLAPQEYRTALRMLAGSYPQGMLVVLLSRILPQNVIRFALQRHLRKHASETCGTRYSRRIASSLHSPRDHWNRREL